MSAARVVRTMLLALLLALTAQAAWAESRVALVVGNASYVKFGSLPNSATDATAIADTLRAVGFQVTLVTDQNLDDMRKRMNVFASAAQAADVSLVYYAGHGIEVNGRNYLIPTDALLESDVDVRHQTLPLDDVLDAVERSSGLGIVILDACRDNPFLAALKASKGRSIGQGLAKVDAPFGVLVAFSAAEGAVAADGRQGQHSPFATALLRHIREPGLELNMLMGKVREDVMVATAEKQSPRSFSSLSGKPFYFVPAPEATAPAKQVIEDIAGGARAGALDERVMELQYWNSVEGTKDPAEYRAYLETYPTGRFAALARHRLGLNAPATTTAQPQVPQPQVPVSTGSVELASNTTTDPTTRTSGPPAPPVSEPVATPPQRTESPPVQAPPVEEQKSAPAPVQVAAAPVGPTLIQLLASMPVVTAGPAGPLDPPPMIPFALPVLPKAFCQQTDQNSYLTQYHTLLDQVAKRNNETAIKHFEALTAAFNQSIKTEAGKPQFTAISQALDSFNPKMKEHHAMAERVNALYGAIRAIPVKADAPECQKEPWPPLTPPAAGQLALGR